MTLQEAKTLHAHMSWATNRIFESLGQLPAELYTKDLKSSHGGVHGTLCHMIGAVTRMLARWSGTPDKDLPAMPNFADLGEAKAAWEKNGYEMAKFLGTMTDTKLQDTFPMTMAGETVRFTIAQGLQHLADHTTFHRGQIVGMIRQLGAKPPSTGLIGFFKETSKLK